MANKLAVKILCYLMCADVCFNGNAFVSDGMIPQVGDENNGPGLRQNLRRKIIRVPYINQCGEKLVSACEAVSAAMILYYLGFHVTPEDLAYIHIPRRDWKVVNGIIYASNPQSAYPGNPGIASGLNCGFGVFAGPVAKGMNKVLDLSRYEAIVTTGLSLDDLVKNYIDKDIPVLVWATMDMKPSSPGCTWTIDYVDENSSYKIGDTYTWMRGEHCLVLVGYDDENYYFNDPYKNHGLIAYNKPLVEQRFLEMGKQSVVVISKEDVPK